MPGLEQQVRERIAELRDDLRRHERALAALQPPKAKAADEGKKKKTTRRKKRAASNDRAPSEESITKVREFMLEHRGEELMTTEIADGSGVGASTVSRVVKMLAGDPDQLVKHNGKGGAYSRYMIPEQEATVPETPVPPQPEKQLA